VLVTVPGGYAPKLDYGPLTPDDAEARARAAKNHPSVPAMLDAGDAREH
jgi:hypothetical protein